MLANNVVVVRLMEDLEGTLQYGGVWYCVGTAPVAGESVDLPW